MAKLELGCARESTLSTADVGRRATLREKTPSGHAASRAGPNQRWCRRPRTQLTTKWCFEVRAAPIFGQNFRIVFDPTWGRRLKQNGEPQWCVQLLRSRQRSAL